MRLARTRRRDSADVALGRSAAKFVVEGAGAKYNPREIEANRKSRVGAFPEGGRLV